jgi:SAM-dependent methyltransferase
MMTASQTPQARFATEYARQRASEGRATTTDELMVLPYLRRGPVARQWRVRARSYEALINVVVQPLARSRQAPLDILDVGAGNGWLCRRLARFGHRAIALDLRADAVDGLGAARACLDSGEAPFSLVCGSFDALPLRDQNFDVVIFNASLHYALDLTQVLREAVRVARSGARLVILDSPFYGNERAGAAMVAEKRATAGAVFGTRADALLALPFIEFLTRARLRAAAPAPGLQWRRHRVRYPLWYEVRPLVARLQRRRRPSRFDLWECRLP